MEDETRNSLPSPELPPSPSPSFVAALDTMFAQEDPRLLGCLTDSLNLWWRTQALNGRGAATDEDLLRLLRGFHLVLQALPNAKQAIPFAPRGRLTAEQGERVVAELEAHVAKTPSFLRGPRG